MVWRALVIAVKRQVNWYNHFNPNLVLTCRRPRICTIRRVKHRRTNNPRPLLLYCLYLNCSRRLFCSWRCADGHQGHGTAWDHSHLEMKRKIILTCRFQYIAWWLPKFPHTPSSDALCTYLFTVGTRTLAQAGEFFTWALCNFEA